MARTPDETKNEVRKLIRNIGRRVKNIEELGFVAPQYATKRFHELTDNMKSLSKMDEKELNTLYRDLKYVDSLKSSTVKGAIDVGRNFEPIKQDLDTLSEDTRKKFWEIYEKFYERTAGTAEAYKYIVFERNIDEIFAGNTDVDEIVHNLIEAYDKSLMETGGEDENAMRLQFSSNLDELFGRS